MWNTIKEYKYRFLVFLWLLAVIMGILIWIFMYEAKATEIGYQSLSGCFYEQPRIPYIPKIEVLATKTTPELEIDNHVRILDCMIEAESGGNPDALNPLDTDGLPAYGLLQFKEGTFKRYCVDKYGYPDDIWNPGIQYSCADKMLRAGLGHHWPTIYNCI